MSKSIPLSNQSIAVDQDADHDDLVDAIMQLVEENRNLRQEVADLREQVETNTEDIQEQAKADARDRQRLTEAEERLDAVEQPDNTQGSTGEDTPADTQERPQTPLERTTTLPEEMIDGETANVRRAVFVAADLDDYTTKVPAGRAIKSGELRRVLKAGTDCRGHSQTVDRVISVLDDMGGDEVQVVERRGERRVVFTEQIVTRLQRLTAEQEANHDVVTLEAT